MTISQPSPLWIVGLGPGDASCLTPQANDALSRADCIVGYSLYIDLLPHELLSRKTIVSTGMRQEEERCTKAIDTALSGIPTALVSSGDPGIYAMAGLVLELLEARDQLSALPLTILPGVPALCAAASLLGAPLSHDFACISLSDLLTPLESILRRLEAALSADFVLVLYNPRSHGRPFYLAQALKLARRYRAPNCPVGIVRKAFRPGQSVAVHNLSDVPVDTADMLSLVIIGNSQSRQAGRYFLTPRGYPISRRDGMKTR